MCQEPYWTCINACRSVKPGQKDKSAWREVEANEGDREQVYCELESVLREEDSRLPCGVLNRLLAEVSQDLMAAQGVATEVKMAASNILVALARSHFSLVMAELQSQLKAVGKSREFVLITLSRLFSIYALQCIPFVWLTLAGLCSVVGQTKSGQTLRFACAVVKQWSEGIRVHLCSGKQCPWPATEKERILEKLYQLFCSVERNWQGCKEEKDKKAVLEAVVAMMVVLLEKELHREHMWEQLLWLTHQYQEVEDTSGVTKGLVQSRETLLSLIVFLEALKGVQPGIPRDRFLAITSAVFYQLLWPRLMLYVVPAQYTGMLIPVSRCIQALAERKDLAARETEELDSHFLNSLFQAGAGAVAGALPTYVAHAVFPARGRVGPSHMAISQQVTLLPHLRFFLPEQSFLYKALGTALGACKDVLHIQEKLLQHLEESNAEGLSEVQLKPSLESKDTLHLLNLCWKNIVMNPSAEMMLKMRKSQRAAQYLQIKQQSCHGLGKPSDLVLTLALSRNVLFHLIIANYAVIRVIINFTEKK
ncbi:hypothetical protein ASZ78_001055 [Callipepla squamata]|uniref:Uncharacterized protein n=1 Tax=Callipepla squamata TaxID=9009 RepID=A0A226N8P1_CALSU|nr:hypothetical protein ASZ78_001055 [Callipepla squamata]